MSATPPYWKAKPLTAMSRAEWEALCDGCGRCCLHKLRDEDTDVLAWTNVACRLLDTATGRCGDYANRRNRVPDCIKLTPARLGRIDWLPPTCAYRLVQEGRDLPEWHPLLSGDRDTVRQAGISVRDRVVSERWRTTSPIGRAAGPTWRRTRRQPPTVTCRRTTTTGKEELP